MEHEALDEEIHESVFNQRTVYVAQSLRPRGDSSGNCVLAMGGGTSVFFELVEPGHAKYCFQHSR